MSDRIIQGFSEMKNIYLTQILNESKDEECDDYGEKYEGNYKKRGKKSKDYDGDGEIEDEADEYAGVKDKAIRRAMERDDEDEDEDEKPRRKRHSRRSKKHEDDEDEMTNESFSNWRDDLYEVISTLQNEPKLKDIDNEQITEKPVKNKVIINPSVTERFSLMNAIGELGGTVMSLTEEDDYLYEAIDLATEYFLNEGLDAQDVQDIIDEVGVESFTEWVMNLDDNILTEARAARRQKPKSDGLTPQQRYEQEKAKIEAREAAKKKPSKPAKSIVSSKGGALVHVPQQTRRQEVAQRLARASRGEVSDRGKGNRPSLPASPDKSVKPKNKGVFDVVASAVSKGLERDKAARAKAQDLASQTVSTARRAGEIAQHFGSSMREPFEKTKAGRNTQAFLIRGLRGATRGARDIAAREIARRRVANEEFENWVEYLLDEGYDLSDWTWDNLYEEYEFLTEKAVSEQQQKLFGLALSVKRGQTSRSEVSKEVLNIVDTMSTAEIRKFAGTKHKGLPYSKEQ